MSYRDRYELESANPFTTGFIGLCFLVLFAILIILMLFIAITPDSTEPHYVQRVAMCMENPEMTRPACMRVCEYGDYVYHDCIDYVISYERKT